MESTSLSKLEQWIEENPSEIKRVIDKIIEASNAREAARKARINKKKNRSEKHIPARQACRLPRKIQNYLNYLL